MDKNIINKEARTSPTTRNMSRSFSRDRCLHCDSEQQHRKQGGGGQCHRHFRLCDLACGGPSSPSSLPAGRYLLWNPHVQTSEQASTLTEVDEQQTPSPTRRGSPRGEAGDGEDIYQSYSSFFLHYTHRHHNLNGFHLLLRNRSTFRTPVATTPSQGARDPKDPYCIHPTWLLIFKSPCCVKESKRLFWCMSDSLSLAVCLVWDFQSTEVSSGEKKGMLKLPVSTLIKPVCMFVCAKWISLASALHTLHVEVMGRRSAAINLSSSDKVGNGSNR